MSYQPRSIHPVTRALQRGVQLRRGSSSTKGMAAAAERGRRTVGFGLHMQGASLLVLYGHEKVFSVLSKFCAT